MKIQNKGPAYIMKMLLGLAVGGTLLAMALGGFLFWHFSRGLPKLITAADYRPLVVTRVLAGGDKNPTLIGEFYKERRYIIPYEKIPQSVVRAFISAEDDRFFEHPGINIFSMIRAGIANFRAGHVVQGGSTITQQVAKSLLLTPERSFMRKIKEIILSGRIEKYLTKQQILYLYLNQIYLGHGAYGVEAASQTYFRKSAADLSVAEAAILAGLPQAPSNYSPILSPQKAKVRQRYVLSRMAENGYITQDQRQKAVDQQVRIFHDENINLKYAPYWVEQIRRHLVEKYGNAAVYESGMTVVVPSTPEILLAARKNLVDGLEAVDKRVGYRGPVKQLSTNEEMETFLREERVQLMQEKLQYTLLMPDGRLNSLEAMKAAGLTESALLQPGKNYQAVVTAVDDKKKSTSVLIGAIRAEIPFSKMEWAYPAREDKAPLAARVPPRLPSKVVKRGDVILVKPYEVSERAVMASLEQEPRVQGALFSIDADTGAVLAMEGGYDFESSEFNRAIQAQRQPGSSFKPIIYAAGLEKGFNPASVIQDSPIVYEDGDQGKWKPANFEEKFYGDTTFRQALIKSRNVPTIKIVQSISVPFVVDYAKRIGLNAQLSPDLSISLGSGAVNLVDLTKTYALFPRLGRRVNPVFISNVIDREGKVLEENKSQPVPVASPIVQAPPSPGPTPLAVVDPAKNSGRPPVVFPTFPLPSDPDQVMDPRVAYVMTHLMKEVVAYGTGHAAQGLGRAAAGKTGTTNEYIDAWFMGFTPHVVTGVWVGFDNHRSIGPLETGARAALPIWLGYMKEAVKNKPDDDFSVPPGVVFAAIDPVSGKLAPHNSSTAIEEAFIDGTQPTEVTEKTAVSSESQSEFFKEDVE